MNQRIKISVVLIVVVAVICLLAVLIFVPREKPESAQENPLDTTGAVSDEPSNTVRVEKALPEYDDYYGEAGVPTIGGSSYTAEIPELEPAVYDPNTDPDLDMSNLSEEQIAGFLNLLHWDEEYQARVEQEHRLGMDNGDPWYFQKQYLQEHPEVEIQGFGNPYVPGSPSYGIFNQETGKLLYVSSPVSFTYNENGDTISIGVTDATDGQRLYIVPSCSAASEPFKQIVFAFCIGLDNLMIINPAVESTSIGENGAAGYANFIVGNHTHDCLYPSAYQLSGNYWRLGWADWKRDQGLTTETDTLYGRAIDYHSGDLLSTFRVEIAYDPATDTYKFGQIYDSEAVANKELTNAQRQTLIEEAVAFLAGNKALLPYIPDLEWKQNAVADSIVEVLPETYYTAFYSPTLEVISFNSADAEDNQIIAVNIPATDGQGVGYYTVYFKAPKSKTIDLSSTTLLGFDAINQKSSYSIMDINGFFDGY